MEQDEYELILIWGEKGYSSSGNAGSTGTPNAMYIIFEVVWYIEIDY
jgi:hypothetical protein